MLLRFLTLATVSMTYLTVQAVSSTETKSERLSATSAFTHEHITELPSLNQIALLGKNQAMQRSAPPLPKSFKIAVFAAKAHSKSLRNARSKKINNKKKKPFVRLAYMPSSHNPTKLKQSDLFVKKSHAKSKNSPKAKLVVHKKKPSGVNKRRKRKNSYARKPKYSLGARVASKKVAKLKRYRAAKRKRARRVRYRPVNYMNALSGGAY